jgi:recA bacterial DNA recombination protein
MPHLSLVKTLSHLQQEQKHIDEIRLEAHGLSLMRGSVAEIAGGASSGKTSIALSVIAQLTAAGEVCALVDSTGSFDPVSANLAGVELANLLWIRCGGELEKSFLAADYLVQAKGFGCVWLNLNGLPQNKLRLVPRTYWYRYRSRIKETPTLFLVTAEEHITGSVSQQAFTFSREDSYWSGTGRFKLLREFHLKYHSRKGSFGPPQRMRIEMDYSDV